MLIPALEPEMEKLLIRTGPACFLRNRMLTLFRRRCSLLTSYVEVLFSKSALQLHGFMLRDYNGNDDSKSVSDCPYTSEDK